MRRAIFLDRDGVINALHYDADHGIVDSPANADQFKLLPGVGEALRKVNASDFLAIVVSNQPGIAKGKFTETLLETITLRMHTELDAFKARVDAVYYCRHHPDAIDPAYKRICDCRKPAPGLLLRARDDWRIDLHSSFMVGDGISDIQAGTRAGCQTVWLGQTRCDTCRMMHDSDSTPSFVAASLPHALDLLLEGGYGDISRRGEPRRHPTVANMRRP